jgi:acyl-CoA synthetase (AMP-forming)/AMP-acid ligase II
VPKGVIRDHYSFLNNSYITLECRNDNHMFDTHYNTFIMYHIGSTLISTIGALRTAKQTIYPPAKFDHGKILKEISFYKCNTLSASPKNLHDLLVASECNNYDLSNLEYIISAGQRVPQDLIDKVKKKWNVNKFCIVYGMTEIHSAIMSDLNGRTNKNLNYIGRPMPFIEYKIVDERDHKIVPFNEIGQLWIKGYNVTKGYFNNHEKNKETFDENGW